MTSQLTPDLTVHRTAFSSLPGFSRLFTDYCEHFERVEEFFAADFRTADQLSSQCDRVLSLERDRELLVRVLLDQNERWGLNDATRQNIERLASAESVAVVTGQQVGLFGGPLYTVYKTATMIRLADGWSTPDRPVVPVFWLEGEDHDLDEVRSSHILGSKGLFTVDYDAGPPPEEGNHGPVGRLVLTALIAETIDRIDEELPPSDFHDDLIRTLREAYQPGVTFRDAFARFMRGLFPDSGLVFISPDDRRLKDAAIPLFLKEIEESSEVARRVDDVNVRLTRDYHAQVRVRPTNLFYIDEKGRSAIDSDAAGERFSIRHHESDFDRDELIAMIKSDPCAFSPNVVLRPLLQDRILPTLAYVAGPGEIAYLAQFKPVYEWAHQPMPVVHPRASMTIVESRIQKILSRYELTVPDAAADIEALFKKVVLDKMQIDLPGRFESASRLLYESVEEVRAVVVGTDPTLEKALEATRASLRNEWSRLEGRVLKAEKRRHDDDRRRLDRLQESLFPSGGLQERGLSILSFLNKYGLEFAGNLLTALSTDTREHQIVVLEH